MNTKIDEQKNKSNSKKISNKRSRLLPPQINNPIRGTKLRT